MTEEPKKQNADSFMEHLRREIVAVAPREWGWAMPSVRPIAPLPTVTEILVHRHGKPLSDAEVAMKLLEDMADDRATVVLRKRDYEVHRPEGASGSPDLHVAIASVWQMYREMRGGRWRI